MRLLTFLLYPFVVSHYKSLWNLKRSVQGCCGLKRKFLTQCYWRWCAQFGAWIGIDAKIAGDPVLPHGLNGIHISGGASIGKNCIIYHQVTIGSDLLDGSGGGAPMLGENCYIGAGAKIIGKIKVGNNVRVGANCCVYKSVPDDCVAVNSPTRIIQKSNLVNRLYTRRDNKWTYYQDGKWINCPPPVIK